MSSEELLSVREQKIRDKNAQKARSEENLTTNETGDHGEDLITSLKMAGTRASQGTKRHLSLSPLKDLRVCMNDFVDLEASCPMNIGHISKRRVLSTQEIGEIGNASDLTGNDPEGGQVKIRNHPGPELSHTESKMAPPMVVNNNSISPTEIEAPERRRDKLVNETDQELGNIDPQPVLPQNPRLVCISGKNNEETLLKNCIADATNEETLLKNGIADATNGNLILAVDETLQERTPAIGTANNSNEDDNDLEKHLATNAIELDISPPHQPSPAPT